MGQEAKATGNWRVNNSPTIKRIAKSQLTKQKSKCQLAAQGYNNARTITYYPAPYSGSRGKTRNRKNQKQTGRQVGHLSSPGLMRSRSSVQNLWDGLGRAADPAGTRSRGVEAHSSRKHAGQVAALYDR
jgi:hypothetical protein